MANGHNFTLQRKIRGGRRCTVAHTVYFYQHEKRAKNGTKTGSYDTLLHMFFHNARRPALRQCVSD